MFASSAAAARPVARHGSTGPVTSSGRVARTVRGGRRRHRAVEVAANERAGYDTGRRDEDRPPTPDGPDPAPAGDLRGAVATAAAALAQVHRLG